MRRAIGAWDGCRLCATGPEWHSDTVSAIVVPGEIDARDVLRIGYEKYRASFGSGLSRVMGKVFRIGHLGDLNEGMCLTALAIAEMALADADGKVTDAGNVADTGRLLMVNRSQWRVGFRRELLIETTRDIQKRQNIMVVSMRLAFMERTGNRATATHTALQYNVTGVA